MPDRTIARAAVALVLVFLALLPSLTGDRPWGGGLMLAALGLVAVAVAILWDRLGRLGRAATLATGGFVLVLLLPWWVKTPTLGPDLLVLAVPTAAVAGGLAYLLSGPLGSSVGRPLLFALGFGLPALLPGLFGGRPLPGSLLLTVVGVAIGIVLSQLVRRSETRLTRSLALSLAWTACQLLGRWLFFTRPYDLSDVILGILSGMLVFALNWFLVPQLRKR